MARGIRGGGIRVSDRYIWRGNNPSGNGIKETVEKNTCLAPLEFANSRIVCKTNAKHDPRKIVYHGRNIMHCAHEMISSQRLKYNFNIFTMSMIDEFAWKIIAR